MTVGNPLMSHWLSLMEARAVMGLIVTRLILTSFIKYSIPMNHTAF